MMMMTKSDLPALSKAYCLFARRLCYRGGRGSTQCFVDGGVGRWEVCVVDWRASLRWRNDVSAHPGYGPVGGGADLRFWKA